jgi:hypothetical protein
LPDKAGEVVVLEIFGQDVFGEIGSIENDESVVVFTP